jgi:tripartite ATP-independent transporter DctM subunit
LNPLLLLFLSFAAIAVIRVPIAYALVLSSLVTTLYVGLSPALVVQQMFQGLNSFTLMALPFFLLAGQLMNSGNITDRLVRLAQAMVGHIRGGLAHISVVVSMIFAGMSGSSVAETAGVGALMIPAMKQKNYDSRFAVALIASASTMGVIIPPSITMIVYGAMGNVSIGALFLAGAIPGLLVGVSQMGFCYYYARRNGIEAETRTSGREFVDGARHAFLPLMIPVIIVGGVVSGVFTATEAGMVATIYALFLIMLVYRKMPLRDLPSVFVESAVLYSQPLLAVAAATVFGWLLAYFQAPEAIANLAGGIVDSPTLTVVFVALIFLIVGTFMDAIPAIIIFMPVVAKLVEASGADPIHMGIIVIMSLAMGLVTPPYGLCLMIASSIGKVKMNSVMPIMFVFYTLFLSILVLVAVFPSVALFLPDQLMPGGQPR